MRSWAWIRWTPACQKLFFQTFKKFNQNASRKETFTKERIKKEALPKETSLFFSFSTNLFLERKALPKELYFLSTGSFFRKKVFPKKEKVL